MKIRILDNTLRIRFSQTELNSLAKSGVVKQEMIFPNSNKFIYSLNAVSDSSLTAEYIGNEIKVHIPEEKLDELLNTDLVGVENNFSGISILVEKDFKCLTERKEDETELFQNPLKRQPKVLMSVLQDKHGRTLDYLRLSVTDRCNLRCSYCMPSEGVAFEPKEELLSYEEIIRLAHLLKSQGLKKIRITGGEPFVRKDLDKLLRAFRLDVGIEKLHITTNGTLTLAHLKLLTEIKIDSVNLSLDTLRKDRFYTITHRDKFTEVWGTMMELLNAGIRTKLNVVMQKGINDDEIIPFVNLARTKPLSIRFIEAMPFNGLNNNKNEHFINYDSILHEILSVFPQAVQSNPVSNSSAVNYSIPGFTGSFAIIPAYSRTLCGSCNRLRLSAVGEIRTCLYADSSVNLKDMLRKGADDEILLKSIYDCIHKKALNGFEAEAERNNNIISESMVSLGG